MGNDSRSDFRFNLDLVMAEIGRWPITTTIAMTGLTAAFVIQPKIVLETEPEATLGAFEVAIVVAGCLLGALGLKALILLSVYPRLHKAAFPGSYLQTSFVSFVPIFAFYAAGFYVINAVTKMDAPPLFIALFLLGYPLFSVLFAGAMRVTHAFVL